jgi:hypothetical protein
VQVSLSDHDIATKAVQLGLIAEGEQLPRHLRSRVVAALLADQQQRSAASAPVAGSIVVTPGVGIEIDGHPFPWVIQRDAIEVVLDPSGQGLVRLTIPTKSVQIIKPEKPEN